MIRDILRGDERIDRALRELYDSYGYSRFKMSKFEEYELYVKNKDFLAGDRMITFTDGDGTLLALKPDVTISIIKNTLQDEGGIRKVYYNENVYRVDRGQTRFREILQTGLECVGAVDAYQIFEVIYLAVRSLGRISPDYMLDLSHMGLVTGLMAVAGVPQESYARVLGCIREKNPTELSQVIEGLRLDARGTALLQLLIDLYGDLKSTLEVLEPYCTAPEAQEALLELRTVDRMLRASGLCSRVQLDFSVTSGMGYYNGILFRGFVKGVPEGILSGGQYDRLVEKMGKSFRAIGFAITLNELERLAAREGKYDVDVLLRYDEDTELEELCRRSHELVSAGKRIVTQAGLCVGLRARETVDLRGERGSGHE